MPLARNCYAGLDGRLRICVEAFLDLLTQKLRQNNPFLIGYKTSKTPHEILFRLVPESLLDMGNCG
jgi:hypothetical protein